jgi:DNA (cytosine-5)-methyltransferase 3A
MSKNVLSLFDGISGLQLALKKLGIKIHHYYASEINEIAMTITQHRFPNTIQLGDVSKIKGNNLPKIWLLSAGSPCQDFSIAGTKKGMSTIDDKEITSLPQYLKLKKKGHAFHGQSHLFWEFIRLYHELNPKYFFLENVRMTDKWKYIISRELGCLPILINSNTVSAQNRERYYWTNIPNVSQPKDKNILLSNVIPNAIGGYGKRGVDLGNKKPNGSILWEQRETVRKDGKANCITTKKSNTSFVKLTNGIIRHITIEEAEVLQTLPKNYTNVPGLTETERWHSIGNGWTIDVITHLLKGTKKDLVKRK